MTTEGKLVLYIGEKNISSWSMRGWLAMHIKELSFEERTIELRTDKDRRQRREVSSTGRVPVLRHGDLTIPDSLAIIEYLEETFPAPKHPPLWPTEKSARAHARWLAAAMHSGFPKLREGMSFNLCFLRSQPKPPQEAVQEATEMLDYFEDALSRKQAQGAFLFGDFGAVDAMFAPAVLRLTSFDVPTQRAPRAAAYLQAVLNHPLVERWHHEARALPPRETY
ncbi:MAG: glutathione S-transferase [Acidobacteria bacterium]|nr:glutathione S-transferase [Acidobacteriota bacterium]